MRLFFFILLFFVSKNLFASDLTFYVDQAHKNNPKLNAERENLKAIKENINISKVNFYLVLLYLEHRKAPNRIIEQINLAQR